MAVEKWIAVKISLSSPVPSLEELIWNLLADYEPVGVDFSGPSVSTIYFSEVSFRQDFVDRFRKWALKTLPADDAPPAITVEEVIKQNWNEEWKKSFTSISIGQRFMVLPPWESVEAAHRVGRLPIVIEPGMAFGTGTHATTQLCLELMEKIDFSGKLVLDVGTGSGILALAVILLGAQWCLGIDIDPDIIENAAANRRLNPKAGSYVSVVVGRLEDLRRRPFDVALCNMLSHESLPLLPLVREFLRPGASLVLSGFLTEESLRVHRALEELGFEVAEHREEGEWGAFSSIRR